MNLNYHEYKLSVISDLPLLSDYLVNEQQRGVFCKGLARGGFVTTELPRLVSSTIACAYLVNGYRHIVVCRLVCHKLVERTC